MGLTPLGKGQWRPETRPGGGNRWASPVSRENVVGRAKRRGNAVNALPDDVHDTAGKPGSEAADNTPARPAGAGTTHEPQSCPATFTGR
ncbi:hypothetical protein Lfu02_32570 [Longispora fulva]|nr:hypothetical protein Lfu02_32570 [Longispora fulva]